MTAQPCANCDTAVVPDGQNWKHVGGGYRCTPPWNGDGFAVPLDTEQLREQLREEILDDLECECQ